MKKERLPKGVLQGLFFSIGFTILFVVLAINYFYPQFNEIENKKQKLTNLQKENNSLKKEGLKYSEFKKLFLKNKTSKDEYFNNILSDPTKDVVGTYEKNLINSGTGTYDEFIKNKTTEVKNRELDLKNSKLKEKIEKILPYYKNNASLDVDGITDFRFINYIEKVLHNFGLDYVGNIGIGEFKSIDEKKYKTKNKKPKSQLEGEIYSFKLPLKITGKKKNIIDFIYYIENVGTIYFTENNDDIKVKEANPRKIIVKDGKKIKNDFYNLPRYFLGEKDIFNNIVCEIESIKLPNYPDSSLSPIAYDKGETFISFLKNDQANEKYEVDIVLKFYVKGLEIYKTKKYIENVQLKYNKITKTIISAISFGKKNRTELSRKALFSLKNLEEYNLYLKSISKDIKDLSNPKKINTELGNLYKKSQSYNKILETISNALENDLKNISEKIYNTYVESNKKQKDKND